MSEHPGLTLATVDPDTADEAEAQRLRGWGEALHRGFHQGRMDDLRVRIWLDAARADEVVLRGFWPEKTEVGDPAKPVATFASWGGSLNVGGGRRLPAHLISDVTVSPTHRRRGLMRSLMQRDLADAVERDRPVAALTVSEGSIYGRFGFGAATRLRSVEVDVTGRFALHAPDDVGTLELAEPLEAWAGVQQVFARHHEQTRGSVGRPHFYEPILTGAFDWENGGPDPKLRAVVHLDPSGSPDGYALWKHVGQQDGRSTVDVSDLLATNPGTQRQLWRLLADLDLVERLRWHRAPLDGVLDWAVTDPRVVRTTGVRDLLWVRVLDLPAALAARPWAADGDVVLDVHDALGYAGGRWRVVTSAGRAEITAYAGSAPAVSLAVETLGSLYLGGVDVATLADAGRLTGPGESLTVFAAMADGAGTAPYCTTQF